MSLYPANVPLPHFHRLRGCLSLLLIGTIAALSVGCGSLSSRGLNSQGVRLFEQARYQEAVHRFQQAIDRDPKNPDGYYNLAATYHRLGTANGSQPDLGRAEQYYHLCLDHDPNHRECYRGLAVLLADQDRSEEAFRLIKGWASKSPSVAEPKIEMARLLEEFGDRELAKQQLIDALAIDDKNPRALAALGRLREQTGDAAQALAAYQRSLSYDRFQPEVAARVASLHASVGASAPAGGNGGLPTVPSSGGTRTVTGNPPTLR